MFLYEAMEKSLFQNWSIEKVRIIYTFHQFTSGCQCIVPLEDLKKSKDVFVIPSVSSGSVLFLPKKLKLHINAATREH
jgi:hypothetical protein